MVSKSVANSMLVLRILAFDASIATIALVVTDNVTFDDPDLGKWRFYDLVALRYVVAVAAISAVYGIAQLPLAFYYAVQQQRMIRNGCLPDFDFYGDKVISLVLATAIGVGIGVCYEFKRVLGNLFKSAGIPKSDPRRSTINNYFDRGIIASSVLGFACLCMALLSVISSINRSRAKATF